MAKQLYEKKVVTNLCGILIKNEDNSYTVSVADKDDITEYDLNEILNECVGQVISFKSEI